MCSLTLHVALKLLLHVYTLECWTPRSVYAYIYIYLGACATGCTLPSITFFLLVYKRREDALSLLQRDNPVYSVDLSTMDRALHAPSFVSVWSHRSFSQASLCDALREKLLSQTVSPLNLGHLTKTGGLATEQGKKRNEKKKKRLWPSFERIPNRTTGGGEEEKWTTNRECLPVQPLSDMWATDGTYLALGLINSHGLILLAP